MKYLYFREVDFFNLKMYDFYGYWDELMVVVYYSLFIYVDSLINIVRFRYFFLFINMYVNMYNYIYNRCIIVLYFIKSDMIKRNVKS